MTSSTRSFVSLYLGLDAFGLSSTNLRTDVPDIQRFWTFAPSFCESCHLKLSLAAADEAGHGLDGHQMPDFSDRVRE